MAMGSKNIFKYVGVTALCAQAGAKRPEKLYLPCLLQTRGQRPLAWTPYAMPRQTFGLEMSVCAGHAEWRCIVIVQLKGKETVLSIC